MPPESANDVPHSYHEAVLSMPRIPDAHLQSVVFIYRSEEAARTGAQHGGSGFVVNYPAGIGDWRIRYVVTNAHVIDSGGQWVRLNCSGGTYILHIPHDQWDTAPPDDFAIAVLRLPPQVAPFELSLDTLAVTRQEVQALGVGPGDEVYMIGRFVAHGGRIANNPIARFGSISLMPNPDELVLDGRGNDVEAYLIEMRSHAGFSGSAVFLLIPQQSFRGVIGDTSRESNVTHFRLLGIDAGHKLDLMPVEEWDSGAWHERNDLQVKHLSDVAIVVPIWKVVDLLKRDDLAEQRAELGNELEEQRRREAVGPHAADTRSTEPGTPKDPAPALLQPPSPDADG